ncbi:SDR family oxidoreductase [Shewanella corallii]|uniref:SDR family oxidoreductase n=1 Tax=Shewanella corallii TaxID=560080 RepID=A0ABT0NCK7_9GAMM|nr:SDR family oxidoreductase [Shewanella corallii]MCL2915517.1 SDR family oxidoreductase [Shewanella corallii]
MTETIFDLTGQTALVTGASSGLGKHFAKVLALRGARVSVCARRIEKLSSLVTEIEAFGGQALAIQMDVTDSKSVKAAFDLTQERWGGVNIVSNNAGISEARLAVHCDEPSWDRVLETNLKGAWRVAMEAGLRAINGGHKCSIVNTASILGLRVSLAQSSYATSKAAVIQLTRSLALEWSRKNVRVNALCPGYFLTELNQDYFATDKGISYINSMPMQRLGRLEELTAPFLMLASEAGSFITGVALPVDGGHSNANM